MECLRCRGFMVREWLSDILNVSYSWKCINCGAIVDTIITENRRSSPVRQIPCHSDQAP